MFARTIFNIFAWSNTTVVDHKFILVEKLSCASNSQLCLLSNVNSQHCWINRVSWRSKFTTQRHFVHSLKVDSYNFKANPSQFGYCNSNYFNFAKQKFHSELMLAVTKQPFNVWYHDELTEQNLHFCFRKVCICARCARFARVKNGRLLSFFAVLILLG